jgi:hypothetical protein
LSPKSESAAARSARVCGMDLAFASDAEEKHESEQGFDAEEHPYQ